MRLIDADELKKSFAEYGETAKFLQDFCQKLIDNASTVEAIPTELHEKILEKAVTDLFKAQEELNRMRNEKRQGEWLRKEDVIHHIAKQYSEHNEIVPIWLSIADMRGKKNDV